LNDNNLEKIISLDEIDFARFWGSNNKNLDFIKILFPQTRIIVRGEMLKIVGNQNDITSFECLLQKLVTHFLQNGNLDEDAIMRIAEGSALPQSDGGEILVHGRNGLLVKARTPNQQRLVEACAKNDLVFAIGPAGTGKTYTAVALAVRALRSKEVRRIILTRPAVEAGENLGFLPGDLREKLDPYLQPLYDALRDMIPQQKLQSLWEEKTIEIAPLAFMRGRTLDNAFVILDEAQNATSAQIKMFLTRMGRNAKFIVTGDLTQIDLPRYQSSGLSHAISILEGISNISVIRLDNSDVIRHKLVTKIINAYERNPQQLNNEKPKEES
jgi:phosphate starvation-inducible PhoH-like protein